MNILLIDFKYSFIHEDVDKSDIDNCLFGRFSSNLSIENIEM